MHNICIVNNEGIKENWIIEPESKLARKIIEGEEGEDNELQGEKTRVAEMRRKIIAREHMPIGDEENDAEINSFLLRENEKANDLFVGSYSNAQHIGRRFVAIQTMQKSNIIEIDDDSDIHLMD